MLGDSIFQGYSYYLGDSVFLPAESRKQNGIKIEDNEICEDEYMEECEDIKIDVGELQKTGCLNPKQISDSLCMILKEEIEKKLEFKGEFQLVMFRLNTKQ